MSFILLDESKVELADAITHAGKFHACDVFATVLLSKVFKDIKICRIKKCPEKNNATIVYDIGGGKFDHHRPGFNMCRNNGIRYSSFGLLWELLDDLLSFGENAELALAIFDISFVSVIDAIENGQVEKLPNEKVHIISVSEVIEAFNPNLNEDINENEAFLKAVEMATVIFDNAMRNAIYQSKLMDMFIG